MKTATQMNRLNSSDIFTNDSIVLNRRRTINTHWTVLNMINWNTRNLSSQKRWHLIIRTLPYADSTKSEHSKTPTARNQNSRIRLQHEIRTLPYANSTKSELSQTLTARNQNSRKRWQHEIRTLANTDSTKSELSHTPTARNQNSRVRRQHEIKTLAYADITEIRTSETRTSQKSELSQTLFNLLRWTQIKPRLRHVCRPRRMFQLCKVPWKYMWHCAERIFAEIGKLLKLTVQLYNKSKDKVLNYLAPVYLINNMDNQMYNPVLSF